MVRAEVRANQTPFDRGGLTRFGRTNSEPNSELSKCLPRGGFGRWSGFGGGVSFPAREIPNLANLAIRVFKVSSTKRTADETVRGGRRQPARRGPGPVSTTRPTRTLYIPAGWRPRGGGRRAGRGGHGGDAHRGRPPVCPVGVAEATLPRDGRPVEVFADRLESEPVEARRTIPRPTRCSPTSTTSGEECRRQVAVATIEGGNPWRRRQQDLAARPRAGWPGSSAASGRSSRARPAAPTRTCSDATHPKSVHRRQAQDRPHRSDPVRLDARSSPSKEKKMPVLALFDKNRPGVPAGRSLR